MVSFLATLRPLLYRPIDEPLDHVTIRWPIARDEPDARIGGSRLSPRLRLRRVRVSQPWVKIKVSSPFPRWALFLRFDRPRHTGQANHARFAESRPGGSPRVESGCRSLPPAQVGAKETRDRSQLKPPHRLPCSASLTESTLHPGSEACDKGKRRPAHTTNEEQCAGRQSPEPLADGDKWCCLQSLSKLSITEVTSRC